MTKPISKSQIDSLGKRLKKGKSSDEDLQLLEQYRQSFATAYEIVCNSIREKLSLETTGRQKTTQSIVDKLRRESIRLTQIQDIAGCRVIAIDIANQNEVVASLRNHFENVIIVDRCENPSHGYRAVHVIVEFEGKLIEIQVRTTLQQLWAELSEKLADMFGQEVKYGGGSNDTKSLLEMSSEEIIRIEAAEKAWENVGNNILLQRPELKVLLSSILSEKPVMLDTLHDVIKGFEFELRRDSHDFFD